MPENIVVNQDNCPEVVARLVKALRGKIFRTEGVMITASRQTPTKIVSDLRLYEEMTVHNDFDPQIGYRIDNGEVTIPVSPGWLIHWNLNNEKVMVSFINDGKVIIEKKPNRTSATYSLVITITGNIKAKGESSG